jgi:hypothetical protein
MIMNLQRIGKHLKGTTVRAKYLYLACAMFFSTSLFGQNIKLSKGDWIVQRVETLDSIVVYNVSDFQRFRIISDNAVDVFKGYDLTVKQKAENLTYSISGDTLKINSKPAVAFLIEKITGNDMVLQRSRQRFFLKKVLVTKRWTLSAKNYYKYKVLDNDIINFRTLAKFDGDFFRYFATNSPTKSSFVVEASFILKKDKRIERIVVNSSDKGVTDMITEMIRASLSKWKPAVSFKNAKLDSKIRIFILFKSAEIQDFREVSYFNKCLNIYEEARKFQKADKLDLAETLYTDYISTYKFTILNFDCLHGNNCPALLAELNTALLNRAQLLIKKGRTTEICDDLRMVFGFDEYTSKAQRYSKMYCQQ